MNLARRYVIYLLSNFVLIEGIIDQSESGYYTQPRTSLSSSKFLFDFKTKIGLNHLIVFEVCTYILVMLFKLGCNFSILMSAWIVFKLFTVSKFDLR